MRIALLGPIEVQRDGRAEPPGGRRLGALLARLEDARLRAQADRIGEQLAGGDGARSRAAHTTR